MGSNGKIAMVTGAGSGIGQSSALALLQGRVLGGPGGPSP